MNEIEVEVLARNALSEIRMQVPLEAIVARGRAHRRRRRQMAGFAVVTVVAAAGVATGVLGSAHSSHQPPEDSVAASPTGRVGDVHVSLAGFTLDSAPGGDATLTLIKGGVIDPKVLSQDLAQAGIPAIVNVGRNCGNAVQDSGALDRVISSSKRSDGTVTNTFTPSAIPAGDEISIGLFPGGQTFGLVTAGAPLSCTGAPASMR
jgi:hypothetical protein